MNIMVFDVAAESGGALSVLTDYYKEYSRDKNNTYYFVLSKPLLEQKGNLEIINIPWVKRSWFHRLFFDLFISRFLIKKYKINKIISLQNLIIPFLNLKQTVLVHNALPFSDYKINLLESPKLWFYQNIIGFFIRKSCKNADCIIVQTNWMKRNISEQLCIEEAKICVKAPTIKMINHVKSLVDAKDKNTFFYPAGGGVYKNHKIIIAACNSLIEKNIIDFQVIFTLDGTENKNTKKLKKLVDTHNLPISFIGHLSQQEVFLYFRKSILLFPSYIETIGLPLIEAKEHETQILVADCEYSHAVLNDYKYVTFFNPHDSVALENILLNILGMNNVISTKKGNNATIKN